MTPPAASPIAASSEVAIPRARALRLPLDPLLTLAALGLAVCSLVTLRAATQHLIAGQPRYYVDRQATYLVVGLVLMVALSRFDYSRFRHMAYGIYAALILSILAVLGLGHTARGSQRAINFPLFSFQASEIGKVLLILALSALVASRARRLQEVSTTARVMLAALIPALFVIAQPDLGSGLVYMVIAFTLLFVAGTSWRQLTAILALVLVAGGLVLVGAPAAGVHVLKPFQEERLTAFLHPSSNPEKQGYQQEESKVAIGAGQKTGRGAAATQTKLNFVPEDHTDFIFAAVGEQYGFVGAALVLSLYALLIWRTLAVLTMAKDMFGSLVAGGVVAMLMLAVGIMPITGVTLPLMSYGGSSVITTLLAVGLLQSIYVQASASQAQKGRVFRY
jgi:rod shape determining protein RodA